MFQSVHTCLIQQSKVKIFLTVAHCSTLDHHGQRKDRKKEGQKRDKHRGFSSTFLHGCFYESAFHSKNTPHTPSALVRSLDALVVTLL